MDGYQRISRYRTELTGMAVLVVVYGHLLYYHSGLQNYEDLNFTEWYTLGSVEMFLFLSGFGVFQSLRKDRDAFSFYGRRLGRILPSYLPVAVIFCVLGLLAKDMRPEEVMRNLTGVGWWFGPGNQFNWYVPAILTLYFLSPLFYDCLERSWKNGLWVFAVMAALIVAGWRSNILIALTRFPAYYLGMWAGKQYADGKSPTKKQLWLWTVAGALSLAFVVPYFFLRGKRYLWYYGMYWLPFFFSTPMTMFGLSKLTEFQEKNAPGRWINRFWAFLGKRSFEIYLCHLLLFELCLALGLRGWPKWICAAVVGTLIGAAYHEAQERVRRAWRGRSVKV